MVDGGLSHLPSSSELPWEEVADGFQIADFVSPVFRNLHIEKDYLLIEHKAENISFHRRYPKSVWAYKQILKKERGNSCWDKHMGLRTCVLHCFNSV